MSLRWLFVGLVLVGVGWPVVADEPLKKAEPKKAGKTFEVPFRLTDTQHLLVRIKINGQGPFNFVLDTGAPLLYIATAVGKKVGLESDKGWTTLDKLEMEGGVVQTKVKCRVETPFQLEGMNGLGMAGVELHGMLGYTVLARYKMEFDFTRDKMKWTELDFKPPFPQPVKGKDGGSQAGLEIIGSVMKFLGFLSGAKANPDLIPRGFLGIELAEADGKVTVKSVLAKSPAASAGLKTGDLIEKVRGFAVAKAADVHRLTAQLVAGQTVFLHIQRGNKKEEITVTAGEGL